LRFDGYSRLLCKKADFFVDILREFQKNLTDEDKQSYLKISRLVLQALERFDFVTCRVKIAG